MSSCNLMCEISEIRKHELINLLECLGFYCNTEEIANHLIIIEGGGVFCPEIEDKEIMVIDIVRIYKNKLIFKFNDYLTPNITAKFMLFFSYVLGYAGFKLQIDLPTKLEPAGFFDICMPDEYEIPVRCRIHGESINHK